MTAMSNPDRAVTRMQMERDPEWNGLRFSGFISARDIEVVSLDDFDRAVLNDCFGEGRDAADWLLAFELIFRRLGQTAAPDDSKARASARATPNPDPQGGARHRASTFDSRAA